ncbi:gamma carbonic anhydrase family protein [Oceaniserpentilla sp. 4NH20-0058]|uniref:gamma carbonic anhydrase family protein n=1 Tax=Oceaniserpentilla sp. 4NH20-0058 TaxID=3127660 RepID=UPI00310BB74B
MGALRSFKGMTPKLGLQVFVDDSAVVIGDVELGDDVSVWPNTVIRGDMHRIKIGDRCSIQDGSILHITHASDYNPGGYPLTLGNDVTVGHMAMLHGCTIGSEVLIGMQAMVMDGAVVEDKVVIGAGSLVPPGKLLKSGYLYVGRPAKAIRELNDKELSYFKYTAANYVKLKNDYLDSV